MELKETEYRSLDHSHSRVQPGLRDIYPLIQQLHRHSVSSFDCDTVDSG